MNAPNDTLRAPFPIELSNLRRLRVIGQGPYSTIFEVVDQQTFHKYALKEIDLRTITAKARQNVANEVRIHRRLSHANIVRLIDTFTSIDRQSILLELCERGNLFKLEKRQKLNAEQIQFVFCQVVNGLKHLHSTGVILRDLKPENVLLTNDYKVKLCDFGWAIEVVNSRKHCERAGTLAYMSPESLQAEPQSYASDMWSLGVLLYEMIVEEEPYKGDTFESLLKDIVARGTTVVKDELNCQVEDILRGLLDRHTETRMSMEALCQTDYVREGLSLTPKVFSFNYLDSSHQNVRLLPRDNKTSIREIQRPPKTIKRRAGSSSRTKEPTISEFKIPSTVLSELKPKKLTFNQINEPKTVTPKFTKTQKKLPNSKQITVFIDETPKTQIEFNTKPAFHFSFHGQNDGSSRTSILVSPALPEGSSSKASNASPSLQLEHGREQSQKRTSCCCQVKKLKKSTQPAFQKSIKVLKIDIGNKCLSKRKSSSFQGENQLSKLKVFDPVKDKVKTVGTLVNDPLRLAIRKAKGTRQKGVTDSRNQPELVPEILKFKPVEHLNKTSESELSCFYKSHRTNNRKELRPLALEIREGHSLKEPTLNSERAMKSGQSSKNVHMYDV